MCRFYEIFHFTIPNLVLCSWYVLFETNSYRFVTGFQNYLRFISPIEPNPAPLTKRLIPAWKEVFLHRANFHDRIWITFWIELRLSWRDAHTFQCLSSSLIWPLERLRTFRLSLQCHSHTPAFLMLLQEGKEGTVIHRLCPRPHMTCSPAHAWAPEGVLLGNKEHPQSPSQWERSWLSLHNMSNNMT